MKTLFTRLGLAAATLSLSAQELLAQSYSTCSWWRPWTCTSSGSTSTTTTTTTSTSGDSSSSVPEIDVSSGLLAVVAVLAVMAFVWDRRRRAARA